MAGSFCTSELAVDSEKPSDTNHQWLRTKVMSSIAFPGFCVKSSYGDGATVNEALEEGWKQGVAHSMADGILTQAEETLLRDRLAMDSAGIDRKAAEQLERESTDRLMLDARLAAIAVEGADAHLRDLTHSLQQSRLYRDQEAALLVRA